MTRGYCRATSPVPVRNNSRMQFTDKTELTNAGDCRADEARSFAEVPRRVPQQQCASLDFLPDIARRRSKGKLSNFLLNFASV